MRDTGLREAKRAAVQRDLALAAVRLVAERGMASVTADDIAAEVNVSRRTFFNYYSCKEEAVAALLQLQVVAALDAWTPPANGGVLATMRHLVDHQVDAGTLGALVELTTLAGADEHLVPYVREAQWRMWRSVGECVLTAVGRSGPDDVLDVDVVTGALFSVVTHALLTEAHDGTRSPDSLRRPLYRVLDRLEHGVGPAA